MSSPVAPSERTGSAQPDPLVSEAERRRRNFEQRRLEHLREVRRLHEGGA